MKNILLTVSVLMTSTIAHAQNSSTEILENTAAKNADSAMQSKHNCNVFVSGKTTEEVIGKLRDHGYTLVESKDEASYWLITMLETKNITDATMAWMVGFGSTDKYRSSYDVSWYVNESLVDHWADEVTFSGDISPYKLDFDKAQRQVVRKAGRCP